jgi:hypothetical protein
MRFSVQIPILSKKKKKIFKIIYSSLMVFDIGFSLILKVIRDTNFAEENQLFSLLLFHQSSTHNSHSNVKKRINSTF